MSDVKLYKCYKGTCSRCIDDENPFITEDEYNDLLDADGNIQCPEGHMECGIQVLKPEDFPKPPTNSKKNILVIGGVVLLFLLLGAGGYTYYWFSKTKKTVNTGIQAVEKVKEVVEESGIVPVIKDKIDELSQEQETLASETQQPSQPNKLDEKTVANIPAPVVPPVQKEPACPQISAASIEEFLNKVADKRIPSCEKEDMVKNYTRFFQSSAFVNIVDNNGSVKRRFSVRDYITRLRGNGKQVFIQQGGQVDGNKYVELMVTEI